MLPASPAVLALLCLVASVPAAVRLGRNRLLARFKDDATLPERLLAARKQHRGVVIICCAIIIALGAFRGLWFLPLLMLLNTAAGYPLRRHLYEETWSLAAYLSFLVRLSVGSFGFWILLGLTPALAGAGGTPQWLVPAVCGVILLAWNEWSADVFRALARARPLADPALMETFQALAMRAGVPMPRFEFVDLRGGFLANAVAVPSRRRSAVVFTDSLLARLTPDEVTAICGHEIAHLEYYDRRRMRNYAWVNRAIIAGAAFIFPSGSLSGGYLSDVGLFLVPMAIVGNAVWRAKDRQRNETISDERAVALTGNAEALATALTKLHTWARVPRRYDQADEQRATHPSLARRIRDIRAAAGSVPDPLPIASQVTAADGSARVMFEPERIRWTEGHAIEHSLGYSALSELRIDASAQGQAKLVAVAPGGHRWSMPVAQADAATVQSLLDRVDGHLASPAAVPRLSPVTARIFTLLAAMVSLGTGQIGGAIVAALASAQPAQSMIVACGVACLASALLAVRGTWSNAGMIGVLALVGIGLLAMAWFKRGVAPQEKAGKAVGLLAALSAVFLASAATQGLAPVTLYQAVREVPAAPVTLIALAAALAVARRRSVRFAALPLAGVAVALVAVGSTAFLEAFGRDPFLIHGDGVTWTTIAGDNAVAESTVRGYVSTLQLSPHGRSVIASKPVATADDGEYSTPGTAYVGRMGDELSPLRGDAFVFIDDARVLVARSSGATVELSEYEVGGNRRLLWRDEIPRAASGDLAIDRRTEQWRLLGRVRDEEFLRLEGQVGTPDVVTMRWRTPGPEHTASIGALAASGSSLVALTRKFDLGSVGAAMPLMLPLTYRPRFTAELWRMSDTDVSLAATSMLDTACAAAVDDPRLICTAFDGSRTRVVTISPLDARIEPAASLDGRFVVYGSRPANGWIAGWSESALSLVNLGSHRGVRISSTTPARLHAAAAADGWVAAVQFDGTTSHIRLYRAAAP